MYAHAKSRVRVENNISTSFSCEQGVRQGENLSPILFAVYLNDFQDTLSNHFQGLNTISSEISEEIETLIKLYTLLYADDTIIMAETAEKLQKTLNALHDYCHMWDLKVNINKTKIIIFSRGKVRKHPKFYLNSTEIEVVEDYTYLGVVFNYNGSFKKAIEKQIAQARKALFSLLQKAKILKLPIDLICDLFDKTVLPVLIYGCEVWGFTDISDVEIFYRKFLRNLLKTFRFTPNCMLYGELGVTDIKTKIVNRMVLYWAKLKFGKQEKLSAILCNFLSKTNDPIGYPFKWNNHVKSALDKTGFSWVWNIHKLNIIRFKSEFKQRLVDMFIQQWQAEIAENSQCTSYRLFKNTFKIEKYWSKLEPVHSINISKFRTRTHHLPVTKNRFNLLQNTACTLCDEEVEGDEVHYLFACQFFSKARAELMPSHTYPCNNKNYTELFQQDEQGLKNLSKFTKIIMMNFEYKGNETKNVTEAEIVITSRSGRRIIPPSKLDI